MFVKYENPAGAKINAEVTINEATTLEAVHLYPINRESIIIGSAWTILNTSIVLYWAKYWIWKKTEKIARGIINENFLVCPVKIQNPKI